MADFSVRCPADYLNRLLVQGAWSRCGLCTLALRIERGVENCAHASASRKRAAEALTHPCRACGEEKPKD
eukprot:11042950-Karenia_brevis.AAC.1